MTDYASSQEQGPDGVSPVPPGYTALTPFLVVAGAAKAIEFYCEVFGATVVHRTDGPDGSVPHAELDFGRGRLQLGDPSPGHGLVAPEDSPAVNHSTMTYCTDVDEVFQRAVTAGAKAIAEPATFVTGDRYGVVIDPFGHRWAIMTKVEDVSPEESERRVQQWLADQARDD